MAVPRILLELLVPYVTPLGAQEQPDDIARAKEVLGSYPGDTVAWCRLDTSVAVKRAGWDY